MKITLKLAASIFAALSIVLVANVYVGIRLQAAASERDAAQDQMAMAGAIATAVESVWHIHGQGQAMAVIERADQRNLLITVRWIDLDAPEAEVRLGARAVLGQQEAVRDIRTDSEGQRIMSSRVPVSVDGTNGAIEIKEPLVEQRRFVSSFTVTAAITGAVMTLLSGLLAFGLGRRWVAVPMRHLMDITRRVAQGDFAARTTMTSGTGEVAELAHAMNGMSQDLERAMEQLRHADRLNTVGKLSSGVAHELGTPLHVALGRAKAIWADADAPDHIKDNAAIIVRQADRMSHIIRQLLSFAHAKNLKKRTTNLIGILEEAIAMVRPITQKTDVTVQFSLEDDVPIVDVDPTQMQQVITNLLLNAIHASKTGDTVTLGLARTNKPPYGGLQTTSADYLVCYVEDQGEGIDPEQLPHVFEPFFTTKEVGKGTGLGLSVALGIVREHKGWIDVTSEKGSGSRFSVYLPAS
jgi:signal transduction histidine kinase